MNYCDLLFENKLLFKLLNRSVKHPKMRVRKKNHRRMMIELHKIDPGFKDPVISIKIDKLSVPSLDFESLYPIGFTVMDIDNSLLDIKKGM